MKSVSVDFILTDPPYLCRYQSREAQTIANDDRDEWLVGRTVLFGVSLRDAFRACRRPAPV
ncbi:MULTISPECIES: hypothetical protein [unclassified Bradyrhizobium]|uniref:hypothetical protein n=1 Tax=unclassified Bradyrhizobium TaxID=2631580 RepID=UPI001CD43893|nr:MULTISPECIES: hypothetical protein [unclassified Bradyrhizobium]MCA1379029.1 hypothetical protein [Bradyrhizobium sp. IC4060]MCA1489059.1 hypothetical protein [Bradyrhizobium sp. IC4061]